MKKRNWVLGLLCLLTLTLAACSGRSSETIGSEPAAISSSEAEMADRIPMVMVDGLLYYDTGRESAIDVRCGVMDGEIDSSVAPTEVPADDNQSNFGSGFSYQYAGDNLLEILIWDKWMVFEQRSGDGSTIRFGDQWYSAEGLSEETIAWIAWYNALPYEDQKRISAVPPELLKRSGIAEGQDSPAQSET